MYWLPPSVHEIMFGTAWHLFVSATVRRLPSPSPQRSSRGRSQARVSLGATRWEASGGMFLIGWYLDLPRAYESSTNPYFFLRKILGSSPHCCIRLSACCPPNFRFWGVIYVFPVFFLGLVQLSDRVELDRCFSTRPLPSLPLWIPAHIFILAWRRTVDPNLMLLALGDGSSLR